MKKYITVAALLAAGTAFSNAATVINTAVSNTDINSGSYCGFSFSLSEVTEDYVLTDEAYLLDSLTVFGTRSNGTTPFTTDLSLVVYSVSNGTLSYEGVSATTTASVSSNSSRIYKDEFGSNTYWSRDNLTVSFTGLKLSTDSTYVFFLTSSFSENESTFVGATSLSEISSNLSSQQLSAFNGIATGLTGTLYNTSGPVDTDYSPVLYATISAIPEPSAFGLLAGVGALALVASRRRRTK